MLKPVPCSAIRFTGPSGQKAVLVVKALSGDLNPPVMTYDSKPFDVKEQDIGGGQTLPGAVIEILSGDKILHVLYNFTPGQNGRQSLNEVIEEGGKKRLSELATNKDGTNPDIAYHIIGL